MTYRPLNTASKAGALLPAAANLIGLVVILLVAIGIRARQSAAPPPIVALAAEPVDTLRTVRGEAIALEADVHLLHQQAQQIKAELAGRQDEREQLGTVVAAYKAELARRRGALDAEAQAEYDLKRDLEVARKELEKLHQQRTQLDAQPAQTIKVQSLPTPISKTVHGKEIHFQLRERRLTFIPLDRLLEEFTSSAKNKLWKLDGQAQMTETIGPIGGFRMRYRIGRFEIPPEVARETGRGGSIIRLVKWELLPVSGQLGETADEALAAASQFRQVIATLRPGTSITIWTYPDSFEEYRRIKAELHALNFPTAARPLPDDQPIAGSPDGSKSSAE